MVGPRGIITAFLIGIYCSPLLEFAISKISDKKVNIEFEASLQTKHCYDYQSRHVLLASSIVKNSIVNFESTKAAYLCCTVIPVIEQSTKDGNTAEGINN